MNDEDEADHYYLILFNFSKSMSGGMREKKNDFCPDISYLISEKKSEDNLKDSINNNVKS